MTALSEKAVPLFLEDPSVGAFVALQPYNEHLDFCDVFLQSNVYDQLPDNWKKAVEQSQGRNKAHAATIAYCRYKAEQLAKKHFPEITTLYWSDDSTYCVLAKGYGEEIGQNIAQQFGLSFEPALAMWYMSAWKRIDDRTVIALCGDDRDEYYCLCLAWCPEDFCLKIYDKDYPWTIL